MKQEHQGILHNVRLTCKKKTSLKRKIKCATEARYLSSKHERTLLASLQTVQKQSCAILGTPLASPDAQIYDTEEGAS